MKKDKQQFSTIAGIGLPIAETFATLAGVSGQYIPFSGTGVGIRSVNDYPQKLASIAANSPTHGAALMKKAKLTFGQGIDFEGMSDTLNERMQNINGDMETINDVLEKVSEDLSMFGGFALKVTWNGYKEVHKKIHSIEHVPFKYVRLGEPVKGKICRYVISNDWEQKLKKQLRWEYDIPKFDPNKVNPLYIKGAMVYDEDTMDNSSQLIYYKCYSTAGDGYYPLPDYISCLDSAINEIEVGVSMLKGIENGINGAYIVSTGDTAVDDDSKQEIIDTFNQLTTGAANTGGLIFMPTNVQVHPLNAIPADTYEAINPEVRQRIITAHNIPSILLEYSQSGGFNNRAEEMQTALLQFQQTTIKGYQNKIIRVFNSLLKYMTDEDFVLSIIPFVTEENTNKNIETEEEDVEITDESSLESTND